MVTSRQPQPRSHRPGRDSHAGRRPQRLRPDPGPPAGERLWGRSASTSWTTSRPAKAAATTPTSTSGSASTTSTAASAAPTSDTGEPVSPITLTMLKCDAAYHRVLFSAVSGVMDYGRSTRDWPVDVYNAIALRDAGCRIGACDAPPSWCDVHPRRCPGNKVATHRSPTGHGLPSPPPPAPHVGLLGQAATHGSVELTHPDGRVDISQPAGPCPNTSGATRRQLSLPYQASPGLRLNFSMVGRGSLSAMVRQPRITRCARQRRNPRADDREG